jgi:hypothetical protein
LHTDGITVYRKSSEGGPSKRADWPLAVPQVSSPAPASFAPPPAGGTGSTIRSTVEAKDSVLRVADFLEGLKVAEADCDDTLSSFTTSIL